MMERPSVVGKVDAFKRAKDAEALSEALDALLPCAGELDKDSFPGVGFSVKKGNRDAWSAEVQEKFVAVVRAMG